MTPRLADSQRRKLRTKRRIRAKLSRWFLVFKCKVLQNVSSAFGWLRGVICRSPESGSAHLDPPQIASESGPTEKSEGLRRRRARPRSAGACPRAPERVSHLLCAVFFSSYRLKNHQFHLE